MMEKGRVREERRSKSPPATKEITKPMSTVEEVIKDPLYVVDREKVGFILINAHQSDTSCNVDMVVV